MGSDRVLAFQSTFKPTQLSSKLMSPTLQVLPPRRFRSLPGALAATLSAVFPIGLEGASEVYSTEVLADFPVVYLQFDEDAGSTASESAGHASGPFDATYTGAVTLGAPSFHPNLGTAVDLEGGHIDVPVVGPLTDSTIEVWLQLDALAAGCCTSIASAGDWATDALHWNLKSDFAGEHAVNNQPFVNTAPNTFVADGTTWYHLVVTHGGGVTTWYINGVEVSDNGDHTGGIVYGNSNFQIGAWNGGRLLDGRVDEFAIYDTVLSAERVKAHYDAATAVGGEDPDGDGLPSEWESAHGLDPDDDGTTGESEPGAKDGPNGAGGDPDGDELSNSEEYLRGTDPQDSDSDGDGLLDGEELKTYRTNPLEKDSDGDGLEDGAEVNTHGTNPARADSDGDGLDDGMEVSTHGTSPTEADSDLDGFSDGLEINTLMSDPLDPADPAVGGGGASLYAEAVRADAPLVYYRFEETSGLVATDSSASGKHGTYTGSVNLGVPSVHPNLGSAADLAGGYIEIPNAGTLPESTVEVWIQVDALAAGCCTSIASSGSWSTNALHWNLKSDFAFEHAINSQGNVNTAAGSFVTDGETWYHLVVTNGGGTTTWYVNGMMMESVGNHPGPETVFGNSNFQIGAWNGDRLLDGRVDEFAIYDRILTAEQVLAHYAAATSDPPAAFPLRVSHDGEAGMIRIEWDSKDGLRYNLRSESDPGPADPAEWPVFSGFGQLPATPPTNVVSFPMPAEPTRLFVVEAVLAPPSVIFSDDFEGGQGGWTTGSEGLAGTSWELGMPSNIGPAATPSPERCFGTNLAGEYDFDANVWLRSPVIDLTNAASATLHYAQFHDIETDWDVGTVRVLDADDGSELAVLAAMVDGTTLDWESVSHSLPLSALGGMVRFEFRFTSDDVGNFAGWYLDDVEVTIP